MLRIIGGLLVLAALFYVTAPKPTNVPGGSFCPCCRRRLRIVSIRRGTVQLVCDACDRMFWGFEA